MKIVIDIPEERYKDIQRIAEVQLGLARFQTAEQIIANGTPLPKGHGRLIDISPYEQWFNPVIQYDDGDRTHQVYTKIAPTLIEADNAENKEYGVKVINRGNCMLCGKKLTEGLLFCKECEAKGK